MVFNTFAGRKSGGGSMFDRCSWLCVLVCILISVQAIAGATEQGVVRIGYQKYSALYLLKLNGDLDRRLATTGHRIAWAEFQYGVPMLEALNVGQLDFATTGETPPVLAQSRIGSEIVYVGQEPPSPQSEGILVHSNSAIKKVEDLRGKRVAVAKGTNVHYLLLRVLEKASLLPEEIQWVFLSPGDAGAAFRNRSVDAWAIWDFQKAVTERQLGAKTLVDGQGLVQNFECYTSRASFVTQHIEIIKIVLDELTRIDAWITAHPNVAAEILSKELGIDSDTLLLAYGRRRFGAGATTPALLENQRKIEDILFEQHLIPAQVDVTSAFTLIN